MASNVLQRAKSIASSASGQPAHRHDPARKSPWSQVRDIWRLRYGPGKLRTAMARRAITEAQGT